MITQTVWKYLDVLRNDIHYADPWAIIWLIEIGQETYIYTFY